MTLTIFRAFVRGFVIAIAASLLFLAGCATPGRREERWIRFDAEMQRFAVDAQNVARGALLDQLKAVVGIDIRPQPDRDGTVSAKAENLDLDGLLALLLPSGTHSTVRLGELETVAAPSFGDKRKQGPEAKPIPGAVAKPVPTSERPEPAPRGAELKPTAEASYAQREITGPGTKPPSGTLLRVTGVDQTQPSSKQPLPVRAELVTVRVQLEFSDAAPPRIVDARLIEGRPPVQRLVTGPYLYALVTADGRILDAGTFQDPLIEHSYLPNGSHSVGRARTGVVGISILRDNLAAATLRVVDVRGVPLPRELDDGAIRDALRQGKPALQVDAQAILRLVGQGGKG
jgi:hypothetical protein